jgi:hypothetical protein
MVEYGEDKMQKALVVLAIEQALIEFNNAAYEIVISKLISDFECYLSDCYKHPEYLKKTLIDLYGDSYVGIVELMRLYLGEYATRSDISKFLHKLADNKLNTKPK